MSEVEFNLLYEPWIPVIRHDGSREELSICDIFRYAHEFDRLGGELPTQDVAILRLLLAVLHTVFSRYDLEGNSNRVETPQGARTRWKALWDAGDFPEEMISVYLRRFENRFWLFHPETPFFQVPNLEGATEYPASKLIGELSESNNKIRLFSHRAGESKSDLCFAEAARWLIYVNAFDDTSAKTKTKGLPSPGAGWLGRIGMVQAVGNNLFETLLLNLVLLPDGQNDIWPEEKPFWETEMRTGERTKISVPDNLSELYTVQSRRLQLQRQNNKVTGYLLLGGDFFDSENAFVEQMTIWQRSSSASKSKEEYRPKRHNVSRALWRDFSSLVVQGADIRRPGVVNWLEYLSEHTVIPHSHFNFRTASVKYVDKDMSVDHVFSDSIVFSSRLLNVNFETWVSRIIEGLETTEILVRQLGYFAENLQKAAGQSGGNERRESERVRSQAYFQLDAPFRKWLEQINPDVDDLEQQMKDWWEQSRGIVRRLGRDLIGQAGPKAHVGRTVIEKEKGNPVERVYTAPKAYNQFLYKTSSPQALKKGGKRGD